MTDDSKRTQELPMMQEDPPLRSSRRPSVILEEEPVWENEEASTRNTDAAIALPPVSLRTHPSRAVLTIVSGPTTGRVFSMEGETVIGRGREAHLRIDDTGASRAHARVIPSDRGYVLEDLGSLNGTFVDGKRVHRTELSSGDRIHIGPNIVVAFAILDPQAERLAHQLYESAVRDPLTRAFNRRYLVERLASEIAYASRHRTWLGLILFDIDFFKKVNDTHGHLAGDDVLRDVAALVQRLIRAEDVFARFGGEEFVVLVRGIEHDNVGRFAERIRLAVERLEIACDPVTVKVTISAGYASFAEVAGVSGGVAAGGAAGGGTGAAGDGAAQALLRLADERLYRAKESGRNRVAGA
jgi:two-component system cell cycle response regulator